MRAVALMVALAVAQVGYAPATLGQTQSDLTGQLTGDWTCAMTPKVEGGAAGSGALGFKPDGTLEGRIQFSFEQDGDVIALTVGFAGSWTLNGTQLQEDVADSFLESATVNDASLPDDLLNDLRDATTEELGGLAGVAEVAYVSPHALVLDENEMAISCWR
ncbi:MAG: hypothetical protein R3C52_07700 [Hyphomonadaceae bacterium]